MKQALIIIDVQNDYFPNGRYELSNPDRALQKIIKLQNHFRLLQLPIFYIQHIKSDFNANFFAKGTLGAEIHTSLLAIVKSHEYIIKKAFPNSFYHTDLLATLRTQQFCCRIDEFCQRDQL